MKSLFLVAILLGQLSHAEETCVTSEFAGTTTVRCKEHGEVTSVCKSHEFAGKIYTTCR